MIGGNKFATLRAAFKLKDMAQAATTKGLDVKEAFAQMLDDPKVKLNHKKSYRNRMNTGKITLDKMIELLKANGYKCIQDQIFIKG